MSDERVYEVKVCEACFTQLLHGRVNVSTECPTCLACAPPKIVRFRVTRAQVLEQADPHKSLVERTVYWGCVGESGHYYWLRGESGRPYKPRGSDKGTTPWGYKVDGELLQREGLDLREGVAHVVHEHGWTAVAFTDRSVDSRPGSWSVFCIPDVLDGPEALSIAREAFPTIFARYTFAVRLANDR